MCRNSPGSVLRCTVLTVRVTLPVAVAAAGVVTADASACAALQYGNKYSMAARTSSFQPSCLD